MAKCLINVDFIYPVGAIYISTVSTSPATLFGGTWEAITGRFLLSSGQPQQNTNINHGIIDGDELNWSFGYGQTLGEYRHKLLYSEMPSHAHTSPSISGDGGLAAGAKYNLNSMDKYTGTSGADSPHNNIPPCLVVYMWKRTA